MCCIGKFVGDLFDMLMWYVGDLFCLCWGIGFDFGEIFCCIDIVKFVIQIVVGQNQVIDVDYQVVFVIGQCQLFSWQWVKGYW